MKRFFKWLFIIHDWTPVWFRIGIWPALDDRYIDTRCYYEILYCEDTGKYRLKVRGYRPKDHEQYYDAIEKLNDFISGVNFPANHGGI